MIQNIIDAFAIKLYDIYGFNSYTEYIEQGFSEPCFFIAHEQTTRTEEIGNRSKRNLLFDIMYFDDTTVKLQNMAESLLDNLEDIELSDGTIVHCSNMSTNITDRILHLILEVNLVVGYATNQPEMETLKRKVSTR